MFVKAISIRKAGYFGYGKIDPAAPYQATIEIESQNGKMELVLEEALSQRVLMLIADEVAAAGRRAAEMMTAEVINGTAALVDARD